MRDQVIDLIRSSGLSRIADDLVDLLWDSLRLETQPLNAHSAIGGSRIGGAPDLPPGIPWPERNGVPQSFIAQLNLTEVAMAIGDWSDAQQSPSATQPNKSQVTPGSLELALPSTGMLYFFYAAGPDQQRWGFDPRDRGCWKVVCFDGALESLHLVPLPETVPEDARFRSCGVQYKREITLPDWDSCWVERLHLTKEERSLYVSLEEKLESLGGPSQPAHRLLGHADQIQEDMMLECQLVSNGSYCGDQSGYRDPRRRILESGAAEWRLLLQIDSDDNAGMMWGDLGRIYYWVRQDDLIAHRFDDAWLILQCY